VNDGCLSCSNPTFEIEAESDLDDDGVVYALCSGVCQDGTSEFRLNNPPEAY
jgi:hypothetical protein